MLVLSRKTEQKIQIGDQITITILQVKGNAVKVGIQAPKNVRVLRSEVKTFDDPLENAPPAKGATADQPLAETYTSTVHNPGGERTHVAAGLSGPRNAEARGSATVGLFSHLRRRAPNAAPLPASDRTRDRTSGSSWATHASLQKS